MNNQVEYTNNSYLLVNTRILRENVLSVAASLAPETQIIPVLKADAYGLGMVECAKALAGLPQVHTFAVAHASEALELRRSGIRQDILLLGNPVPFFLPALAEHGITLTAGRPGLLSELAALGLPGKIRVHCKIDSGLHRIGFPPGEMLDSFIKEYREVEAHIELTGAFSHFADGSDRERCAAQTEQFLRGVRQLEDAGIRVPLRHISESAASEMLPEHDLDAIRIGRRLMFDHPAAPNGSVRECASWRTWVTGVFRRRAGEQIGYYTGKVLEQDCTLAVAAVGYGDGLPPAPACTRGHVLIRGRLCPIVTSCMDICIVDVTGTDVSVGDEVTIFGYDREGNYLSAQAQAAAFGADEGCAITSGLSPRVQRIYTEE